MAASRTGALPTALAGLCRSAGQLACMAGLVVGAAALLACDRHREVSARVERSALPDAGEWGRFLEAAPSMGREDDPERRVVRPLRVEGFEVDYRRITIESEAPAGGVLEASLWAGRLSHGARFVYPCSDLEGVVLRSWLFTESGYEMRDVALRGPRRSVNLALPLDKARLFEVEAELGSMSCPGGSEIVFEIDLLGDLGDSGVLLSPPLLVARAKPERPPVILISLDTLRADVWDQRAARPQPLQDLADDSVRFERAFAAAATTDTSHSVMLSGLGPLRGLQAPSADTHAWVAALRDAGWPTLGFVAGGRVRAPLGFGGQGAGFALGFDLYLEEMRLRPADREDEANTHTLAAALERSLRWARRHPGEPFFHFIHGYDVHEYRSVARRYWEEAVAERVASGTPPATLRDCGERVGASEGEDYAVHFRGRVAFRFKRGAQLGAATDCQRLLSEVFYEARVRSVEAALARYLLALRALGIYERSLVVLTSDHGESLLDEVAWEGFPAWGHNRALANNLAVPLWIKLPGARGAGRRVGRPVGLVDLRATLGAALGVDLGAGEGADVLDPDFAREQPIQFVASDAHGFVSGDGGLCAFAWPSLERPADASVRWFSDGRWIGGAAGSARCPLADVAQPPLVEPELSEDVEEELRALGYLR